MFPQYSSVAFRKLLDELNVVQSFSAKGCPFDNAVVEAFFNFLKLRKLTAKIILPLLIYKFRSSNTLTDFTIQSVLILPFIFFPLMILKLNFSPMPDFLSTLLTIVQR